MLLALLSDIHANVRALDACLAHAESIGVKQYAFLGDLVGYGGEPGAVVDRIMGLAESGAIVLKGNHDELAAASAASAVDIEHMEGSIHFGQLKVDSKIKILNPHDEIVVKVITPKAAPTPKEAAQAAKA